MYIYKITNLINNKIYIGQTKYSVNESILYLGSGKLILNAIKKYGVENFKKEIIIDNIINKTLLCELEKHYIRLYNSNNSKFGYNLSAGGESTLGYKFTLEQRKNLSIAHLNSEKHQSACKNPDRNNKMSQTKKGQIRSESHKHNLSIALTGKKRTEESKLKQSIANKGKRLSEETKQKIGQGNKGKIVSEETRQKIGNIHRGKIVSEETRQKIRDKRKLQSPPNKKAKL